MKFMKLGSKPDCFQSDGDNVRYVVTDLATDLVINVGDVKFYLHKFPLLSKCPRLQKLAENTNEDTNDEEIQINDIPGGPAAFEACAKFCYGMMVTLNAYNVVATRCAAEYLEMSETSEKSNLIYKIEVFLNCSIFKSWKDSIIVLQTTRYLLPWSEELKISSHCLNSIASKALMDTAKVEWPYTYNREKLSSENGAKKHQTVPMDWWVEDLCDLQLDLYKRVMTTIIAKGNVSGYVIGEALNAYASRRLPGFDKGVIQKSDNIKYRLLLDTIIRLLPVEMDNVSCSFLLKLLKAAVVLEYEELEVYELMRRIGQNLEKATVSDLLIPAHVGDETVLFDVDTVQRLVEEFIAFEQNNNAEKADDDALIEGELQQEIRSPRKVSDTSKLKVAKLMDNYLAEIARDPNLPLSKFITIAQLVSSFPRPSHDGLYRAIDMYLKEHPKISKSDRKRICRLMDCKKLSAEACMHAVQNERLPLRAVVQVLFFEQIRATTTHDVPKCTRNLLPDVSHGSSRSTTTNIEEEWDDALKRQLATLKLSGGSSDRSSSNDNGGGKGHANKLAAGKMKGLVMSKNIISKIWSSRERNGEITSSDSSESSTSTVLEETKSTPSTSGRQSVS
ncbi:hypothetical protein QN277_003320 [Acacia crassicarpa]|uniref:Uncharacterized protein n=1 Tax=Acacia crassicarpa TaxID=499986 RepID=A0AAE1MCB8_9FABA|nr:hypothetical protein QN277_003320 [Acacia crassicarpa]